MVSTTQKLIVIQFFNYVFFSCIIIAMESPIGSPTLPPRKEEKPPITHIVFEPHDFIFEPNLDSSKKMSGWSIMSSAWTAGFALFGGKESAMEQNVKSFFGLIEDVPLKNPPTSLSTVLWRNYKTPPIFANDLLDNEDDILTKVKEVIEQKSSTLSKESMRLIAEGMFDPTQHAQSLKPVAVVLELIKRINQQEKYQLHMLGNWNSRCCSEVKKLYPDIFARFTHVKMSGDLKVLKSTDPFEMHSKFIEATGLDPRACLFIETEDTYKPFAEKNDAQYIVASKDSLIALERQLIALGIIIPEKTD